MTCINHTDSEVHETHTTVAHEKGAHQVIPEAGFCYQPVEQLFQTFPKAFNLQLA